MKQQPTQPGLGSFSRGFGITSAHKVSRGKILFLTKADDSLPLDECYSLNTWKYGLLTVPMRINTTNPMNEEGGDMEMANGHETLKVKCT